MPPAIDAHDVDSRGRSRAAETRPVSHEHVVRNRQRDLRVTADGHAIRHGRDGRRREPPKRPDVADIRHSSAPRCASPSTLENPGPKIIREGWEAVPWKQRCSPMPSRTASGRRNRRDEAGLPDVQGTSSPRPLRQEARARHQRATEDARDASTSAFRNTANVSRRLPSHGEILPAQPARNPCASR